MGLVLIAVAALLHCSQASPRTTVGKYTINEHLQTYASFLEPKKDMSDFTDPNQLPEIDHLTIYRGEYVACYVDTDTR
jgi:hypothetical protein